MEDRNELGRFNKGASGNPAGRPPGRRAQIDELKQDLEIAVRRGVRFERVLKIVDKMCDLAEKGNVSAAKLILSIAVSPAATAADSKEQTGGIKIVIENATFAAQSAAKQEPRPIEGHVISEE